MVVIKLNKKETINQLEKKKDILMADLVFKRII